MLIAPINSIASSQQIRLTEGVQDARPRRGDVTNIP
jgi:hypothetical protein